MFILTFIFIVQVGSVSHLSFCEVYHADEPKDLIRVGLIIAVLRHLSLLENMKIFITAM